MTQYVIFGGSGFIGSHLREYLARTRPGTVVTIADITQGRTQAPFVHCDVREPIDLHLPGDTAPVLFNLAAVHTTPGHADHEYFETNMLGAQNVCEYARRAGAASIVFTSSIAPYGASEERKTEATLPTPDTPYGISKLVAEKIHMIWQAEDPARRLAIVRPGIVFGQREGGNFTRLYHALRGRMFAYPGRTDTLKAAIYVKDLVRVMVDMCERPLAPAQLYNCCFSTPPRIDTIVQTMQRVIGRQRYVPLIPPLPLKIAASLLGLPGFSRLGFHPDRVKKLMVSTNVDGTRLARDYPLEFDLESALEDWWRDCGRQALY